MKTKGRTSPEKRFCAVVAEEFACPSVLERAGVLLQGPGHPTAEFMEFIAKHDISFEDAAAARQRDGGDHNRRETPLFAASIERKAVDRAEQQAA